MSETDHYHQSIDAILKQLDRSKPEAVELHRIEERLKQIVYAEHSNGVLGKDNYKLYVAQAMIEYYRGDELRAQSTMERAVRTKGESFAFAKEFFSHLSTGQKQQSSVASTHAHNEQNRQATASQTPNTLHKTPAAHTPRGQTKQATNVLIATLAIAAGAVGGLWRLFGGLVVVLGVLYLLLHSVSPWLASAIFDHFKTSIGNFLGPLVRWALILFSVILGVMVTALGAIEAFPLLLGAGLLTLAIGLYSFFLAPSVLASILLPALGAGGIALAAKAWTPVLKQRVLDQGEKFNLDNSLSVVKGDYTKVKGGKIQGLQPYLISAAAIPIAVVVTLYYVAPHRSVQAFCATYKQQTTMLYNKYRQEGNVLNAQTDPLTGLVEGVGDLLSAQGDMIVMFNRLDRVAPSSIEPDVAAVRDSYKQEAQATTQAASDPVGAFASGIVSALQSMGSAQRVDDYIKNNCNLTFMQQFGGSGQSSNLTGAKQRSAPALPTLSTDGVNQNSLQLWSHPQSGIVAVMGNSLVLISPQNYTVTAQLALPNSQGRTPGGDSGKSYSLATYNVQSLDISDFDQNYQRIPLQFASTATDGSDNVDIGYYNLATDQVVDVGKQIAASGYSEFIDPTNRADMLYENYNDNNWYDYNLQTGKTTAYAGAITPDMLDQYLSLSYYDGGETPNYVWNSTHSNLMPLFTNNNVSFIQLANGATGLGCTPIQMISNTTLLCLDGNEHLATIDVSNILNNVTQKDDPSSYNYVAGQLHYELPNPVVLDSSHQIDNYGAGNVVVSSDGKTIVYESGNTLYELDLSSGKVTSVATLPSSTLTLLEWR